MTVPVWPICRTCLIELDESGFCDSCGRLVPLRALMENDGGRGTGSHGHDAPAATKEGL